MQAVVVFLPLLELRVSSGRWIAIKRTETPFDSGALLTSVSVDVSVNICDIVYRAITALVPECCGLHLLRSDILTAVSMWLSALLHQNTKMSFKILPAISQVVRNNKKAYVFPPSLNFYVTPQNSSVQSGY